MSKSSPARLTPWRVSCPQAASGAGTFKDYARTRDPLASERKAAQIDDRFRFLLEALDETFAATGIAVKDAEGNPMIYAETGEATGEEFDERGRLVRAGRGYRWGRVLEDAVNEAG
ncbi:hypothetical protein ASF28_02875 [Methylobacterium sp. Leaf99]|uniref:hypothetical protein n=1 Tax=Methylobacterium sp. Leaf99 TaxID=1736251 RepID=UPI0006FC5A8A|nr:hypothetical protein [Methylobacterium sp. Leaf99]KQP10118.1 hypothetical protein ASF28_02875 [Methylobacterium sp. Leaf99]